MDRVVNFIIWVLAVCWGLAQVAVAIALIALMVSLTGCAGDGAIEQSQQRRLERQHTYDTTPHRGEVEADTHDRRAYQ